MDDLDLGATIKGFSPGQRLFNRYALVRQLGRGGMGVVWAARDEELGSEIALKFLPEVVATDRSAIEDMKREVRRAIDLAHPHIVKIQHFLTDGRMAAVAMEFVQGDTLSSLRVDQPGQIFSPATLAPWVGQLCAALDYAHAKARVAHRDLKPANLMVDAAGDLKILDFGIAASLSESVTRVSKQAGSSGTPVYMSPQQMMGEKPAVTDDIYALGATLYELLTGKPPFYAGNILLQVQNKTAPSLAERREELGVQGEPIPPEWEQTIAACLAKDPKDRPQSAGEVAERLGLTTKDTKNTRQKTEPKVEPGLRTGSERVGTPRSTSKTPLYAGLAAAVLALGGLGWYFGIHAPEQKRLAEIARLEAAQRTEEANRLRTEQERAAAELRDRQERERREAERLAAARGGIVVRTNPSGAEVRVGAIALEKSPLTLKDQRLGKYPVRVRLDGYEEWTGEVEVKENEFADLDVALVRSTGTAAFSSDPPGLEVEVVGRVVPNAPPPAGRQTVRTPADLKLPTGAYDLTFRRPGWPEQQRTIEVGRNQTIPVNAEFMPGSLELTSTPAGAEVWSGGKAVGTTPYRVPEALPGRYDYELRLPRHKAASVAVTVNPRQTTRESVRLEAQPYPVAGQPFENTLGQKFVPVSGTNVLFCIWETREQDYGAFARATGRAWNNANAGATHPAVNVSWDDAVAFCTWLTEKERREDKLGPNQSYRLPTEAEWSVAVGLREGGGTPQSKDAVIKGEYPWGTQWPPPRGAGNYADESAKRKNPGWTIIQGYDDGHAGTAPAGSFTANRFGLHDLGGNVWEWCEDFYNGSSGSRVLRGASFRFSDPVYLLSSYRDCCTPDFRVGNVGFRVVVAPGSSSR